MLTHLTGKPNRMVLVAAAMAALLLVLTGAPRMSAQEADEVEVSFSAPQFDASITALVIFVDGAVCADLPVANLSMPVLLGANCVEDGDTIEFLLYGPIQPEGGADAVRLVQTFEATLGEQVVLSNWSVASSDDALPEYMSAYVAALDDSAPPADSTAEASPTAEVTATEVTDTKTDDLPAVPVVGNLGYTPAGTSLVLLAGAILFTLALIAGGRRTTRPTA